MRPENAGWVQVGEPPVTTLDTNWLEGQAPVPAPAAGAIGVQALPLQVSTWFDVGAFDETGLPCNPATLGDVALPVRSLVSSTAPWADDVAPGSWDDVAEPVRLPKAGCTGAHWFPLQPKNWFAAGVLPETGLP